MGLSPYGAPSRGLRGQFYSAAGAMPSSATRGSSIPDTYTECIKARIYASINAIGYDLCYASVMEASSLNPDALREGIARARERRDRAYAEYEAANRELEWLQAGLRLAGANASEQEGDALLGDLLPEGAQTRKPTLRQAIILVMRANPRSDWSTSDIAEALAMNGWLPRHGEAAKRISDMANVMIKEGHLRRNGRGVYTLSVLLADALGRAMPPITDYRVAAANGLPVPDHPASSEGLADDD